MSLPYHSQWWKRFPLNKGKDIWEDEDGNLRDRKKGVQWKLLCDAQQIVTSRGWFSRIKSRIKCGRWSFTLVISIYSPSYCLNTGNVRPPGSFIYFLSDMMLNYYFFKIRTRFSVLKIYLMKKTHPTGNVTLKKKKCEKCVGIYKKLSCH